MRKTFVLAVAAVALTGCGMVPTVIGGGGQEKQAATQPAAATSTSPSVPADDAASDTALTDQDAAPTPEAGTRPPGSRPLTIPRPDLGGSPPTRADTGPVAPPPPPPPAR